MEKSPMLKKKKKNNRDAAERQFVREAASRQEEERFQHAATAALSEWVAGAANAALLVRLELSFKLRVQTPFGKRMHQPADEPLVHNEEVPTAAVPTWKITAVDESRVLNVRVKKPQSRPSLKTASLFVTAHYLPENEPVKAIVRVMNSLNRHFFKGRSRRTTNPERFAAIACLHDRDAAGDKCRPHLHVLVALPPTMSVADFTTALRRAVKAETFINRRLLVEDANDVAGSVFYNANPNKHSDRSPVIYVHPRPLTDNKEPSR
jgi:hypothetical protein